ncbi:DMT family transporter [Candidatus Pantoea multigeneris]|uniref:DMT family transporter n=1 Tax=Candidatus Pantoea multigeneris TaxID=2608357 RepID=A0ABX0R7Y3_9GAMM|nr:DMT family transporter [Pantoea multigeneris]NIF21473.1 DMT family transporter [Pantoea multigeneris]
MKPVLTKRGVAELLLFCVAAGWGIGFPVMKIVVNDYPVMMVLGLRFLLSALLMLPFSLKKLSKIPPQTLLAGVLLGLLLGGSFIFLIYGLQRTTASNTGFLAGLSVIWVLLLTGPLGGKRPSCEAMLATLFGVAGLYLMADIHGLQLHLGDGLVVIGSLFTAVHILALDRFCARHDTMTLTFLQIATMAVMFIGLQAISGGEVMPHAWSGKLIIALGVTALFSTVIAFWVQTHYQRHTTPTRAILIYNLEPVFSALFALWLLRETLSANVILGGGLILLGMCIPGVLKTFTQRYRKSSNAETEWEG